MLTIGLVNIDLGSELYSKREGPVQAKDICTQIKTEFCLNFPNISNDRRMFHFEFCFAQLRRPNC